MPSAPLLPLHPSLPPRVVFLSSTHSVDLLGPLGLRFPLACLLQILRIPEKEPIIQKSCLGAVAHTCSRKEPRFHMPQGRIARSWLRERKETKSRLISPYILRGSPFSSCFKTQTRQNTEQKRLIQTRRGYGCRPLATVRGTGRIRHTRKGGGGGKKNKLAGVNHLRNFVPTEASVGKTTAAGALGT